MRKIGIIFILMGFQLLIILYKNITNNFDYTIEARKYCPTKIPLVIQFVNSLVQKNLTNNFQRLIASIMKTSSCGIDLHIITDDAGKFKLTEVLHTFKERVVSHFYEVNNISQKLGSVVKAFQVLFSSEKSYYSSPVFFMSVAMHRILDESIQKVIMVDIDTIFLQDIKDLYEIFTLMQPLQLLAMAHEQSPVYYHLTRGVRERDRNSSLGLPVVSGGLPGFNSGVKLLNLDALRKNKFFNSYLMNPHKLKKLSSRIHFKGHLGDQDFFTLLSFYKKDLFYVLPCQWNRQLCVWWKDHGYEDVFRSFHDCQQPYFLLHGNCGTFISIE